MTDKIVLTDGGTSCVGPDAVEVFRLAALVGALKLEIKGMKMSRHMSALAVAKSITGLKTNDRAKHLARVEQMLQEAHAKVDHIDERTAKAE